MTAGGSWGVRSYYLGPFLLILVVAASSASTAAPIVAAALLASVAAFRASRVAVAVADGDIIVRNFWMTYRVSPSEVVECARAKNSGWVGMVRWPYSVIVLSSRTRAPMRVMATAHASMWGENSGRAAEQALLPFMKQDSP